MRIRVFPNFGGSWAGNDVVVSCEESGDWTDLFCDPFDFTAGDVFPHSSMFTQNQASVDAVIDGGAGLTATMAGTITVGGELELPTTPLLPADPDFNLQLQNWRSRADTPSQMIGTYDIRASAPGISGAVTVSVRLEDVVKTTATTVALPRTGGSLASQIRNRIVNHVERRR